MLDDIMGKIIAGLLLFWFFGMPFVFAALDLEAFSLLPPVSAIVILCVYN